MKKIFNKFKQFSRDIKLIIIGALIMSCIGVYATGSCIIAATAEDVTYNNTTVQAAIDELYSMSQSYCPPGYECRFNLYRIMARDSVLDDTSSTYVTSSSGINFSQISSNTNGKGIYEIASTKNDTYPIYYYRGAVTNNNVKFAGFCWKAIRTTDTGGVKLIYNGEPDGSGNCTNTTGSNTQIGTSAFNINTGSLAYVGYMYGTRYIVSSKSSSELMTPYVYGNNVTYNNGTYTLIDTMTSTGTWETDYNTFNNNHYTCFSTGNTCTSVYYIYYTNINSSNRAYYITLTNGKKIEDALEDMFNRNDVNTNDSTIKTVIDNWYNNNLSNYTSYIEDTIYCNNRKISQLGGFDPNGGNTTDTVRFEPDTRDSSTPTLACSGAFDRFTVSSSNGNGALTYPIGLITSDEIIYAGGKRTYSNDTYYLYTNQDYWSLSPSWSIGYSILGYYVSSGGSSNYNNYFHTSLGVRPVISLKIDTIVESGDGTSTNPYVIKTS